MQHQSLEIPTPLAGGKSWSLWFKGQPLKDLMASWQDPESPVDAGEKLRDKKPRGLAADTVWEQGPPRKVQL